MKLFRTAVISAIVLACCGFCYWYFEVRGSKQRQKEVEKETLLFQETDAEVEKIVIRNEGDGIEMERVVPERVVPERVVQERPDPGDDEDYRWVITSPVNTRGDRYAIDAFVAMIAGAKRDEVVWDSLEKEKEYGLDKPSSSLRFYLAGDPQPHGIDFGIESLDGTKVFGKTIGKNSIVSVPAELKNGMMRSLFDLRDKTLAYFKAEDVVEISCISSRGAFQLSREEDQWYLMPGRVKASNMRVEMYAGSLSYGYFVEVVEESAVEVARYGLLSPRLMVSFSLKDGTDYLFLVGNSVRQGDAEYYYATRSTDRMVFQVKAEVVAGLAITEFDIRERRIFDFEYDEVTALSLTRLAPGNGGERIALVREEDEWHFQDTGKTVEYDFVVDSILRGIKNAEYEEVEPVTREDSEWQETGIDNPDFEAVFSFGSGRPPLTVHMSGVDEQTKMMWLSQEGGEIAYYTSGYFMSSFPGDRKELLE